MDREENERETYHTTYYARPPRIAIFFEPKVRDWDSWQSYARRLIGVASENWGGFQFIFIPYDGGEIDEPWLSLLRAYDPDYIARYVQTGADIRYESPDEFNDILEKTIQESELRDADPDDFEQRIAQQRILESWRNSLEDPFFSRTCMGQIGSNTSTFIKVNEGLTEFNQRIPCLSINNPIVGTRFESIAWWNCQTLSDGGLIRLPNLSGENKLYDLWKLAQWGNFIVKPEEEGTPERPDVMEEYPLNDDCFKHMFRRFFVGWTGESNSYVENSPFFLSGFDLKERKLKSDIRYPYKDGIVSMVFGSGFMDFCYYLNLSRLRPFVIWCPDQENHQLQQVYKEVLMDTTSQAQYSETVNLTSVSYDDEQARDKASHLGYIGEDEALGFSTIWHEDRNIEWRDPDKLVLPSARRRFYEKHSFGEHFGPYFDGISGTPIIPPVPKSQKAISVTNSAWITEYISKGFQPPPRTSIIELLADPEGADHLEKGVSKEDVRISSDGECRSNPKGLLHWNIPVHEWITQTQLIRPDDVQIFRRLFNEKGYNISLSDKGRYEREAMYIFGGLEESLKYFNDEYFVKIFDAFTATRDNQDKYANTGRDIVNGDGNILSLKSIRNDSNGPQLQNAEDLIDELISYNAVERGFSLGCERCGRTDWYAVGEVTDSFTCHFCGNSQVYQRAHFNPEPHAGDLNDDPIFFYRLNEMIAQMWKHDGYLPLRTIQKLKKITDHINGGFHYHLEFEAENINGEFDFLASLDGYLTLGECKTAGNDESVKLTQSEGGEDQHDRILRLAKEIKADFIIYCTDGDRWTKSYKNDVQEALNETNINPLFYSNTDLNKEPSDLVDNIVAKLSYHGSE